MKLLLTSAGVRNPSIHDALEAMLGKSVAEADALCIPTAGHPYGTPAGAFRFISGEGGHIPMVGLGWRSVGVLELTALPAVDRERWVDWVRAADVLLVNGGDALYLAHWMQQTGLSDLLGTLDDTVWVGFSAGSMVLTPRIGEEAVLWTPPGGGDRALGVVDFSIFPHLDHPDLPDNSMAHAERWAAGIGGPAYAIDDETAVTVVDGVVDVVSEGHWKRFG